MSTDQAASGGAHLDLVTLADLDAASLEPAAESRVRGHLAGCSDCRLRLASVTGVRTALAAAPAEPLPADIGARLDAALAGAHRSAPVAVERTAVTPVAGRRIGWRPGGGLLAAGAAASIVLLLFGALVIGALRDGNRGAATGTAKSNPAAGRRAGGEISASGRNYTAAALRAAVPALVAKPGRAASASELSVAQAPVELARLREPRALTPCVAELAGRAGVAPLAVDLARYAGKPAAVVVLPETGRPAVLDVWVVGPGCTRGNADLLYFTRLPAATGIASP